MKFTIIEEDLNRAIEAGTKDICTSCIFSQTILRTLNKEHIRSCTSGTQYVQFTFDGSYNEDYKIVNPRLVEIMQKFDEAMFSRGGFDFVRQILPFEFEYNYLGD